MKNEHADKVKRYWDEQANVYGQSVKATSPDEIAFQMEIDKFIENIKPFSKVLDIGCGNGAKGIRITSAIQCDYFGVDYSDAMLYQAKQRPIEHSLPGSLSFRTGNILNINDISFDVFDVVMTDRCLINLETEEEQNQAVKNIHSVLKEDGIYLMMENSVNALENLNNVRKSFCLPAIDVRWHNLYIHEDVFLKKISDIFEVISIDNFASTYYLISRTINSILNNQGGNPDYNSEINMLAAKLPPLGDFSPEKLIVLRKI